MQNSLHFFRVGKADAVVAPKTKKRGADPSACSRCRQMKRKCVRIAEGCNLCTGAAVLCSFSDEHARSGKQTEDLEMTTWLSICLNDSVSSRDAVYNRNVTTLSPATQATGPSGLNPPSQPAGRQLVDAYFRHIHRSYPFLDRAEILGEVNSMLNLSEGFENMSRKLYLVMAIGCTTLRRMGQVSDDICAKYKVSSHLILQDCLLDSSLKSVEELLLLALYKFFDPGGLSPWMISGIIARQIMPMGLTRKLSSNHTFALSQVEARHRLYWSIYSLDRIVSVSTGLPFGLTDANTNIPLPGISLEEYASADREYFTVTLQVNRHIIALRQIESSVLDRIHFVDPLSTGHAPRHAIIADLRTKIEDWYTQGCLINPLERDTVPFHNTIPWLNCRYQNLMLLLYAPSASHYAVSSEHLHILHSATEKYIQLSKILAEQRHLPLNWVTMCRLVALCPTLLYVLVRRGRDVLTAVQDNAARCAEILEGFNDSWLLARKAVAVFRLFQVLQNGCGRDGNGKWFSDEQGLKIDTFLDGARELVEGAMGRSSVYCSVLDATAFTLVESKNNAHLSSWNFGDIPIQDLWMDDLGQ